MARFHALTIKEVRKETADCVSVAFDIPAHLKEEFHFKPGQNITLKFAIGEEELRRSYSICSSPSDNELRIAVKKVHAGKFSGHANDALGAGDIIEVLPPSGNFHAGAEHLQAGNYLAFAAGSGITPVISIIAATLAANPSGTFTLVYGNGDRSNIIFRDRLEALKNRYMNRFILHHVLSREMTDAPVNHGRIDAGKCEQFSKGLIDVASMDHIFLCGPEEMIFNTRDWLISRGVPSSRIHFELFTVPGQKTASGKKSIAVASGKTSRIILKLDGAAVEFDMDVEEQSILDAALRHGADLPFACKGGVCATCKAKLIKGQVEMDNNYALEEEELKAGFILTCQSHPRTDEVFIDFDSR